MIAAQEGYHQVVAILLAKEADVNAANKVSYCNAFYRVFK
jgi:hypothetical protein